MRSISPLLESSRSTCMLRSSAWTPAKRCFSFSPWAGSLFGEVMILLVLVGLSTLLVVAHLAALIAVTAPAGGAVCLLFRSRRKEGHFSEFLLGTVCWACCFLPWLHYVLYGRRRRQAPVWLVWSGYAALFSVWVAGPIAGGFAFAAVASVDTLVEDSGLGFLLYLLPVTNLVGLGWSVVTVVSDFRDRSFGSWARAMWCPSACAWPGASCPTSFCPLNCSSGSLWAVLW